MSFVPKANTIISLTARLRLTSLQPGVVYGGRDKVPCHYSGAIWEVLSPVAKRCDTDLSGIWNLGLLIRRGDSAAKIERHVDTLIAEGHLELG